MQLAERLKSLIVLITFFQTCQLHMQTRRGYSGAGITFKEEIVLGEQSILYEKTFLPSTICQLPYSSK